jgi:hypothetical protein
MEAFFFEFTFHKRIGKVQLIDMQLSINKYRFLNFRHNMPIECFEGNCLWNHTIREDSPMNIKINNSCSKMGIAMEE